MSLRYATMKNMLLFSIIFILLTTSVNANAADSSISITGYVRDNACSVSSESKEFTINFRELATKDLKRIGQKTEEIPFHITLSPCGSSSTAVKIGFKGTADRNNTNLLMVDKGGSKASGVGIMFLDHKKTVVPINGTSSNSDWLTLKPGEKNILTFYTQLIVSSVPVNAGFINASATFTMEFL